MEKKERLLKLHEQENELNIQMGKIDKNMRVLQKQKDKMSKRISVNMKFRNKIINELATKK